MSQALSRKWRPARFEEVIGQEHITRTLKNSVAAGRIGQAYLFCGPRGTGKTTTARLIAKAVNCLHEYLTERPCNDCQHCVAVNEGRFLDLIEIDAASNTGVDDIRDLREKINYAPNQGRCKVYIIDEVHMLSTAAFNALLKTLEEPPDHVVFVLATTEEHKVPLTIKSRCQQFNNRLLTLSEIAGRLQWLAEKEALIIDPAAISLIARQGAGSIRDAESLLDQLVTGPGDTITLEQTQMLLGTATDTAVIALTDAWLKGDGPTGLNIIHEALASGTEARQFSRQIVSYLRQLLLIQAAGSNLEFEETAERQADMMSQAQQASRQKLIETIRGFNEATFISSDSWQPQLPLELAFIESLPAPADYSHRSLTSPEASMVSSEKRFEQSKGESESLSSGTRATELAKVEILATQEEPKSKKDKEDTINLNKVTDQWREMIQQIGQQNKNLPALLNMARPLAVEGNTIILGFDYPIFKAKFDDTKGAAEVVASSFSKLLGIKGNVRCVVTSDYTIPVGKEEIQALAAELGGVIREQ